MGTGLAVLGVPSVLGGGGGWTPSDLETTQLWSRSDLGAYTDAGKTTAAGDSDFVYTWVDQISGRDFVQATEANRFTYVTNAINGRPAMSANATHFASSTYAHASGYTAVYIVQTADGGNNKYLAGETANTDNYLYVLATETIRMGTNLIVASGAGDFPLSVPVCLLAEFNGASSRLEVNGLEVASGNAGTLALDGLTVGRTNGVGNGWIGYIGEVIYIDGILSAEDRAQLETYLAGLWGITFS